MKLRKTINATVFVSLITSLGIVATAHGAAGEQYVVCKLNPQGDNFLALRSCSSAKCQMLNKLPPDTFLVATNASREGRWRQVKVLDGLPNQGNARPMGWVFDKYLCLSEK